MEHANAALMDRLGAMHETLRELLKWLRFENLPRLKEVLEAELEDPRKKLAYEATDGTRALREIQEASGVPARTVLDWWRRWYNLGIVEESGVRKGRMGRIVSLEDVGIGLPKEKPVEPTAELAATEEVE